MTDAVLKLHLATLFICDYDLPTFDEVKCVISHDWTFAHEYSHHDYSGVVLKDFIEKLQERQSEILQFSKSSFLRQFQNYVKTAFPDMALDQNTSAFTFFTKFYDPEMTPKNSSHVDALVSHSMIVVQFLEANERRTWAVFDLLDKVKKCLEDQYRYRLLTTKLGGFPQQDSDDDDDEGKTVTQQDSDVDERKTVTIQCSVCPNDKVCLVDAERKRCSCYAYEENDCEYSSDVNIYEHL